ncbi:carbon-nitrogen family hydrolase [Geothermobacter hydrogeniphilus]|uniref:Carbon-nitrogen hydrolase n=1 Tax=Geothermobacter hydrogeniphilus TaxID=1969733 RepID=A0A1X0XZM3_9BACT|nr:carbon-nitrogen family hydrolase [Geothermobacter hydrogeniphilus]ORJ58292.1 carbon-nitrogen hydrolase [Geothermobacter hydrogeniphilus]
MLSRVKVSSLQFHIALGEIKTNLVKATAALGRVADQGAQLAVLPEMWSCGYDYKRLPELAMETPRVLDELCRISEESGMVIVGSLPEKERENVFNTAYVIDRGRVAGRYRKLHLFSFMGEDRFLSSGKESLVVTTRVGRLGVAICYDLRFPELFRKLTLEGAEIICLPAEWPKPRQDHWRTLLRARAIENQLFIAATNCCGVQGKLDFFGMSLLIEPRGDVLAEAGATDTELIAEFEFAQLQDYRAQIPCADDRRPEVYGKLP